MSRKDEVMEEEKKNQRSSRDKNKEYVFNLLVTHRYRKGNLIKMIFN